MASRSFKNGTWEGNYQIGTRARHNLGLQLVFTSGVDDANGFVELTGRYNAELRLKYPNGDLLELAGWREKERNGIFGTFKSSLGSGSFAIYPSTNPEKVNLDKMASQATQTLVANLMAMGFPPALCEAAPQHVQTPDLEAAIEWITLQLDSPAAKSSGAGAGAAGGAAAKPPSDDAIAQLTAMGFDASQAKLALTQNGNNVERAVEWLFANSS